MLEGAEKTGFRSLAGGDAELHESGQVGRAIRRDRDVHEDGEPDTRMLEKIQEGMQILEGWRR